MTPRLMRRAVLRLGSHRRAGILGLATMCALSGCDGGSGSSGPQTVERDSAGVRIVENLAPAWMTGEEWRLGDEPALDIGGGETEENQLFRVQGSLRLGDGTIVIANVGSSQLKYYTPLGRYLGAAGGEGSGPGEFTGGGGPRELWRSRGDSVAAWDIGNLRVSFFDGHGSFGRSVTLRPRAESIPEVVGLLSDGRMVTVDYVSGDKDYPVGTIYHVLSRYQIYGPDGTWMADIADLPGPERLVYEWTGRKTSGSGPFGRWSWTAVRNDAFNFTSSELFEVLRFHLGTDATSVIRVLAEPHPMTSQDIADYKAERMARAPENPTGSQAWRRWLADVPYPSAFPTYRGLTVDADSNTWAELYNHPTDPAPKWMVLDASGRWLGTVVMPERFTPHDIGEDYVLGVWRDMDDVEHVRMYELLKRVS